MTETIFLDPRNATTFKINTRKIFLKKFNFEDKLIFYARLATDKHKQFREGCCMHVGLYIFDVQHFSFLIILWTSPAFKVLIRVRIEENAMLNLRVCVEHTVENKSFKLLTKVYEHSIT